MVALVGLSIAFELLQWLQGRLFIWVPTAIALFTLVIAVLVLTIHRRWIAAVATVEAALCLTSALKSPIEIYHLTHASTPAFPASVLLLLSSLVAIATGILATIQPYRST